MSGSGRLGGRLGLAALALAVALAAGCLYTRDRTIRTSGRELTPQALASLQKGITTPQDVEKLFGPPQRTLTPGPGGEVLIYDYESQETTNTSVFLLYRSASSLTHAANYRFEFKDGVLTGYTVQSTD
jgi:outer membrane protein assembly factor BamE (lipoprotein component of BamABCDE complex)